jgi:1D-myo-inositol-triphosphate 3-kinase
MVPFNLVASGHAANGGSPLMTLPTDRDGKGQSSALLKPYDATEFKVYEEFAQVPDDPIHEFIPRFHGVVQCSSKSFISISNLLENFDNPVVMDIKLGTRTFLEAECTKRELRPDLYERMATAYAGDISDEELAAKAITKYRWMSLRDSKSTTRSLGFRIDGMVGCSVKQRKAMQAELKHIHSKEQVRTMFRAFASEIGSPDNSVRSLCGRLCQLRAAFEKSEVFRRHECIGTSVLLAADANGRTGAFWIDFAKTQALEESQTISHRSDFELGNREDGVLIGLDNLIDLWEDVAEGMQGSQGGYPLDMLQANPQEGDAKGFVCAPSRGKAETSRDDEGESPRSKRRVSRELLPCIIIGF